VRAIDGVSQRMLAVTQRQLERDVLVLGTVHPVVPPRVDYELTPLGAALHEAVRALVTWTEAPERDRRRPGGQRREGAVTSRGDGNRVDGT
jgi:DNA-binding HxlR family transcriptional regulator